MTEEEKKTLIDAVNCKYPHQNLTEIYYNIGRALPFTAQRFNTLYGFHKTTILSILIGRNSSNQIIM